MQSGKELSVISFCKLFHLDEKIKSQREYDMHLERAQAIGKIVNILIFA